MKMQKKCIWKALSIEPKRRKEPYTKLAEIYMEQEEYEQARNIAEKSHTGTA